MQNKLRVIVVSNLFAISLFLTNGCSEDSNINQIFVSKKQKDSLAGLYEQAQRAFDRGRFEEALKLATKAEQISPYNEDIAILIGYIHLGLAGMDSFRIAEAMIEATKREKAAKKEGTRVNSASIFLGTLKDKLELTSANLKELGEFSEADDLDIFADYEIILPYTADKARESDLEVFTHINTAIAKVCPFVDESVKLPELDRRHSEEQCVPSKIVRTKSVMAHFLWAFTHVIEAAIFYSVVQYQEDGAPQPNIRLRAEALEAEKESLSVTSYTLHALSLAESVNKVFDFQHENSQFNAIISNLQAASLAFTEIGNLPHKVKRSLDRAMTSINSTHGESIGESEIQQKANALKKQINERIGAQMESQIEKLAEDNPEEFAENKDKLCEAYQSIIGSAQLPASCEEE